MTRLELVKLATILLLIIDVSPKTSTRARLKFAIGRASWTSDVSASTIAKRERRLEAMLRHALQCSPIKTYPLRLKLFEWDAENDTFAHGSKAKEFLAKLTVWQGAVSPDDLRPLKRWVVDEFHKLIRR